MDDELIPRQDDKVRDGAAEAASRALIELTTILKPYKDDLLVIGGWVPDLLFPHQGHVGSTDIDFLINQHTIHNDGYKTVQRLLKEAGYTQLNTRRSFTYTKPIAVNEIDYLVDVDLLSGEYGGPKRGSRVHRIKGLRAIKTRGGEFAFHCGATELGLKGYRPDGAIENAKVRVVSLVPYIVLKAQALDGRNKQKDAYDIYFCLTQYSGRMNELFCMFEAHKEQQVVKEMCEILERKFCSADHSGPYDVVKFMRIKDIKEADSVRRKISRLVMALVEQLNSNA